MGVEIGDTVVLKSGGPQMMVEAIDGGRVDCVWHDEKAGPQRASFVEATLTKIPVLSPDKLAKLVGYAL